MTTRIGISIFLAIILITSILLAGGSSASTVAAATRTITNSMTGVSTAKTTTTTTTPIKHLVVILQENVAFDHYFGTCPNATNPLNEPKFVANPHTPINGLTSAGLLTNNNTNSAHPFRLDRSRVVTCDNNQAYAAEQKAYDGG